MPGVWLILPTYNERDNLEPLVRAVLPQLASTGLLHKVLVVDDNSPDGTGAVADRLAAAISDVQVLHRTHKQGLGRAYLAGFEVALQAGASHIMEMDSDFSHDPEDLPRLIAAADAADLVLGSRYVPGGGVTNWGLARRIVSRGGCAYARLVLGVPVRDLTGGFKCFNRHVLEGLDLTG
ncbi:MAG TPA: glycosyltransferase, partial [Thermoleophilaceae bacterium]|nr:glycosyltransferase [Thermoleophilaceae bacterium]